MIKIYCLIHKCMQLQSVTNIIILNQTPLSNNSAVVVLPTNHLVYDQLHISTTVKAVRQYKKSHLRTFQSCAYTI